MASDSDSDMEDQVLKSHNFPIVGCNPFITIPDDHPDVGSELAKIIVAFEALFAEVKEREQNKDKNPNWWLQLKDSYDLNDLGEVKTNILNPHEIPVGNTHVYSSFVEIYKNCHPSKMPLEGASLTFRYSKKNRAVFRSHFSFKETIEKNTDKIERIDNWEDVTFLRGLGRLCMGRCIHLVSLELADESILTVRYVDRETVMKICDHTGQPYPQHTMEYSNMNYDSEDDIKDPVDEDRPLLILYHQERSRSYAPVKTMIANGYDAEEMYELATNYALYKLRNEVANQNEPSGWIVSHIFYESTKEDIRERARDAVDEAKGCFMTTDSILMDYTGIDNEVVICGSKKALVPDATCASAMVRYVPHGSIGEVFTEDNEYYDPSRPIASYPDWYISMVYDKEGPVGSSGAITAREEMHEIVKTILEGYGYPDEPNGPPSPLVVENKEAGDY